MAPQRDLFANFERMRREMDELFGDVFGRPGLTHRRDGFVPTVDVFSCDGPPRVVVKAELAGVDRDSLGLEVQGRTLIIAGLRRATEREGRTYQQVEIAHGPFRRAIELPADVRADEAKAVYEDGMLRVELPLLASSEPVRQVPIEVPES
jgi:HSP20 family protein